MVFVPGSMAVRRDLYSPAALALDRQPVRGHRIGRTAQERRGRWLPAALVAGVFSAVTGLGFAGGQPGAGKTSGTSTAPAKAANEPQPSRLADAGSSALPVGAIARFGTPFPRQDRPISLRLHSGRQGAGDGRQRRRRRPGP